jgi:sec-independent protein translocase protein TatB
MFDISWGELVLVGVVALIVIGPKELPTVLRAAGQWMTKIRRMAAEFQGQFQEALREAEFADLKQQVDSIVDPARALDDINPLAAAQKEIDAALAPQADTTPSGEPADPPAAADVASPDVASPDVASPEASEPSPEQAAPASGEPAPAPAESAAPPPPPAEGGRAA